MSRPMSLDPSDIKAAMAFELLRNRVTLIQQQNTSRAFSRRTRSIGSFISTVNRYCFYGSRSMKEFAMTNRGILATLVLSQLMILFVLIFGPTPTSMISWQLMLWYGSLIISVLTFCTGLSLVNTLFASITHVPPSLFPTISRRSQKQSDPLVDRDCALLDGTCHCKWPAIENCKRYSK